VKRDLKTLCSEEHDILVLGGGIYGVSVAWDAALRGLKAALIDRGDFACATSSNSLKTIHGGLRYLQQLDLARMRECIRERRVLMKIAPHLVHPLPFVMPTYGHGLKSRTALRAALFVTDLVGLDRNGLTDPVKYLPGGRTISKEELRKLLPGYNARGMTGGALWYDCQCHNTERLALSYALSAAKRGADLANYVECTGFLMAAGRVRGVRARDTLTGERLAIRARVIVNACGPWIDEVLGTLNGRRTKRIFMPSSAMNIIVKRKLLEGCATGLPSPCPNGESRASVRRGTRILFFTPWRHYTLIGTNHLPFEGQKGTYRVTEGEIKDFLVSVNAAYPAAEIRRDEISFFHGGLVPTAGISPTGEVRYERRCGIHDHSVEGGVEGLITVCGEKYTTHRTAARRVVDLALRNLGRRPEGCLSDQIHLEGGDIERFEELLREAVRTSGVTDVVARHLVYAYGSTYRDVLEYGQKDSSLLRTVRGSYEVIRAEVVHAVREEMALKLSDTVLRRTGLGSGESPGEETLREVAGIMAAELGWDASRTLSEIDETKATYVPEG